MATASDLLSRYTARLTTQAALVHQPVPTAPVFTDPLTDTGSFTAVQAVSPFAGGDTGSFSLPGPDASYAPYANTQLPSDTGTFTLPTEPYSLETGAFAAPVFDSLAETGSFPAIFPDPQAAAQQPEPRPTATEYAPRPAPGTPGPQPAAPAPAPLDASVSPDPRAVRVAQAIAFARAQLGKPCVWGATGPDSYDCSSLTQAAWRAAGVTLPRAAHQLATAGTPVTLAMLEPGDLVLFFDDDRHVGLCTGDGLMIHAPGPGSTIQEESIYGAGEAAIHRVIRPV
ncbi:C40 family peptidase [Streptomyces sp. J2-1]|nr:C40 family peptidase [Streptomyces corallincola]